jgi:Tfp pilus assembly protein PilO
MSLLENLSISQIKPYLLNPKGLIGVLLIIFALYTAFSEIPVKWGRYQQTQTTNKGLVDTKNNLSQEEARLQTIAKELDKLETKVLEIGPDQPAELAGIDVAQRVVQLSDTASNLYISLAPAPGRLLNVDKAVTLPISSAATAPQAAPSAGGAVPAAPLAGTEPPPDPATALNAFQYTLTVKGTYLNLATFIHNLSRMPTLIMLTQLRLEPNKEMPENMPQPVEGQTPIKPEDLISMKLDFTIPWKPSLTPTGSASNTQSAPAAGDPSAPTEATPFSVAPPDPAEAPSQLGAPPAPKVLPNKSE